MRRRRVVLLIALIALMSAGIAAAYGTWSAPQQVDRTTLGTAGAGAIACPSTTQCFAGIGGGISVFDTTAGQAPSVLNFAMPIPWGSGDNAVSVGALQCPTTSFCAALADVNNDEDDTVEVITSDDPAAGGSSWIPETVPNLPTQLSCPSATLCVGIDVNGDIVSSSHPGDPGSWSATGLPAAMSIVNCPTTSFCAAVDAHGDVWTTADPLGGAPGWTRSTAAAPLAVDDNLNPVGEDELNVVPELLACSGPQLCVAGDGSSGQVLVSTDPGGAAPWTAVQVAPSPVTAVDCVAGTTICLAGAKSGAIATSSNAAAGTAAWTAQPSGLTSAIADISCGGTRCVATDSVGGTPVQSMAGSAGRLSWSPITVTLHDALVGIACAAANDCVTAGAGGGYYGSANPIAGVRSWRLTMPKNTFGKGQRGDNNSIACYAANGCLAVTDQGLSDVEGGQLERWDPRGGAHGFAGVPLPGEDDILFVTCAQRTCVAGYPGNWFQSSDPASNRGWKKVTAPLFDVTCLHHNSSCVALQDGPFNGVAGSHLEIAGHRGGPWRAVDIDPGQDITGMACISSGACVVVDQTGRMLISADPTGAALTWRSSASDPSGFNGVACPSARECVAVDNDGRVVVGRP